MIFQLIYLTYTKIAQHAQVLFFIFLFSFLELVRVVHREVLEFAPHIMIGAPTPLPGILQFPNLSMPSPLRQVPHSVKQFQTVFHYIKTQFFELILEILRNFSLYSETYL